MFRRNRYGQHLNSMQRRCFRPSLERFECRLAPGDGLLGLLFAWPETTAAPLERPFAESSVKFDADADLSLIETLSQSAISVADETSPAVRARSGRVTSDNPLPSLNTGEFDVGAPDGAHYGRQALRTPQHTAAVSANSSGRKILNNVQPLGRSMIATSFSQNGNVHSHPAMGQAKPVAQPTTFDEAYGKLPIAFEQNVGQVDSRVNFIARTAGYTAFLTPTAAVFSIQHSELLDRRAAGLQGVDTPRSPTNAAGVAIHMEIVGAKPQTAVGSEQLPGKVNYFIGNDPSQWRTSISTFGRVEYDNVYPGIDLVYYGKDQQLEYDFVVSPGANPDAIALNFAGADGMEIDRQGNLVLHTALGDLTQQKPYLYQEFNGTRQEVVGEFRIQNSEFRIEDPTLVTFDIGAYDMSRPLVIDPLVLSYSTHLGALGGDGGALIAAGAGGTTYVTGISDSTSFPTTPGAFDQSPNGGYLDSFVSKLNATGTALIYSTYLGGTEGDYPFDIVVDGSGQAYVVGASDSPDFPTTAGAFDTTANGALDSYVTKLSADGSSLVYSTLIGGAEKEEAYGISVDIVGNAYVTAESESADHPTTVGAYDTTFNGDADVTVTKFNPSGSALLYSTYIGGADEEEGWRVSIDALGNAYLVGPTHSADYPTTAGAFDETFNGDIDGYVTKLNPTGTALVYSTFLGGSSTDRTFGLAVDAAGNAYVAGPAKSADFPTTVGAFDTTFNGISDSYVAKLNPAGSALVYSTFIGGTGVEAAHMLAIDSGLNAYITGPTNSADYPVTGDAFDTTVNGATDVHVTKLNSAGTAIVYATFLGGGGGEYGNGIATDGAGNAYVTGFVASRNFPTTPGVIKKGSRGEGDAFVAKFVET